jgi:hypothetical protein
VDAAIRFIEQIVVRWSGKKCAFRSIVITDSGER